MKTPTLRNTHTHDTALLLLRGITGSVFVFHGAQKLFGLFGGPGIDGFAGFLGSIGIPFPVANAWLAAGAEFLGGIALLAGVGVGFASVPLVATMLVACFVLRANGFDGQKGGFEYPLTLAVASLSIGLLGAGRFTLANGIQRLRERSRQNDSSLHQPVLS